MFWNVTYTITDNQTTTVTPKSPGYYSASRVPYTGIASLYLTTSPLTTRDYWGEYITNFSNATGAGQAGEVYYTEAVRAAVAAGTALPPVLADLYIRFSPCGPGLACDLGAGFNSITVDSHVLSVTATGGAYNFQIYYEAVPEPRPRLLIGAGTLFLFGFRRFRRVSSGEKK
jgi:hypothetical protein